MGWKHRLAIIFIIILSVISFSSYEEAYNYYLSGLKFYRSGNYDTAVKFFEKSITLSQDIETNIPEIKLFMGISYFQTKVYDKAGIYLALFPDNAIAKAALESINKNQITQDFHFDGFIITQDTNPATIDEQNTNNFNTSGFIITTLIVFIISALSAVGVFFGLKKFGFSSTTVEVIDSASSNPIDQIQAVSSISIEEVLNLKLDSLEDIWQKSSALKALLGEIDGSSEPAREAPAVKEVTETNTQSNQLSEINDLSGKISESLKSASIDDIESLLDDFGSDSETTESISSSEESIQEEIEEAKENIEKVKNLILPDKALTVKFEKLMNEPEEKIERSIDNINSFEDTINLIEEDNEKNGSGKTSKHQLENLFNSLYFENEEVVS
ncbi:MAG: hypothetical protein H7A31_00980 [Thermotogae bacterium]|nr:hypothetical protein [Thermotogota bacterium]